MGTRNLTLVVQDKKIKVSQYGQWDGYLSGQGVTVAKFIHENLYSCNSLRVLSGKNIKMDKFKKAIEKCTFLTQQELDDISKQTENDKNWQKKYPHLSRDTCAGILEMILKKGGLSLKDEFEFAKDSLFCEWAYLLDMDNEVLEIYKGFNQKPLPKKERFAKLGSHKSNSGDIYYPIKLFKKIPFSEVTPEKMLELAEEYKEETE